MMTDRTAEPDTTFRMAGQIGVGEVIMHKANGDDQIAQWKVTDVEHVKDAKVMFRLARRDDVLVNTAREWFVTVGRYEVRHVVHNPDWHARTTNHVFPSTG